MSMARLHSSSMQPEPLDFDTLALRREIARAMRLAAEDYARASTLNVWQAPESWLQTAIAHDLRDRFYVALEVPTGNVTKWHNTGLLESKTSTELLRSGRIDIVLFNRDPDPDEAHTVGLIEVKKFGQPGVAIDDGLRLKVLARDIDTVRTACVAAHLQCKSSDALDAQIEGLLTEVHASKSSASVEEYRHHGDYCAAIVIELQGLPP
jgi:hypothetical protein